MLAPVGGCWFESNRRSHRESAWLSVAGSNRLWFGVSCVSEVDARLYGELKNVLGSVGGPHHMGNWSPWWRYLDELPAWWSPGEWLHIREPNEPTLRFLSSERDSREEFAHTAAHTVKVLWETRETLKSSSALQLDRASR